MEDLGEKFLEELIDRSLVQVSRRGYTGTNVKTCRVHDLFRDLCTKKVREEKFLEIIQQPSAELDVTLAEPMLRRISIHPSERKVHLKGQHPKLRSLLLPEKETLQELCISKCKSFKFLRVLTLLKRCNYKKWHVSTEIGGAEWMERGIPLRPELITSKNIETLKSVVVDEKPIDYNVVFRLTNIQSLGIVFTRIKYLKPILILLAKLQRLGSLSLELLDLSYPSYLDLEPLSQCHHLSKLRLMGEIEEGPNPSHHVLKFLPPNIVKLTLCDCKMRQDPMGVLGKLLIGLKELNEWEIEEGAMSCLRRLELAHVSSLRTLPAGLKHVI
ncbi:hypothetical protein Gogos_020740 [Gossypium gossypioides]|uniref:Disease resistance protein winged helix domain-containing protein n=1 Tax=Gossypium gossypioides TaxID=34282 RepID=A0A7J9D5T3_GOSGO|nr:hypothetical protein [Gossypium gossypioides]